MKIVTFLRKDGDLPKRVVYFPCERDTFRNKLMETVKDFDEKSYNNNGKPKKPSRILRVKPNFFIFSLFINFSSFFFFSFFFFFFHFLFFNVFIFSFFHFFTIFLHSSSFFFFFFFFFFLDLVLLFLFFSMFFFICFFFSSICIRVYQKKFPPWSVLHGDVVS